MKAARRVRRLWVFVAGGLVVGGCSDKGSAGAGSSLAQVDTLENGRVVVANRAAEWSEGGAWTAEQDLRIGTLEGDGAEQFGQISALEVDPDGRIYVLDFMSQDIRVFETDGSHSHTIGKPGEGPGELMQAAGLNWGPEGNLWVWDPGGRFSIFTPNGDYLDSRPRAVRGVVYPWRGEFDTDGSLVDWGLSYPDMSNMPGAPPPTRAIYYPVRLSGDFQSSDTLPELEFSFELNSDGERMVFGEILSSFQDRQGTIWFAHNKTFTLYRRTLDGDTVLQTSISATPTPVTPHEVDSVRSIYIDQGLPDRAPAPEQFAKTKPMIRRMFSDEAGHLFVLSEQEGLPLGTFVDVFRDTGEYLGRMDLPTPVNFPYPPPVATDSHLYYVTADEFDVEYVVRVKMNKPMDD